MNPHAMPKKLRDLYVLRSANTLFSVYSVRSVVQKGGARVLLPAMHLSSAPPLQKTLRSPRSLRWVIVIQGRSIRIPSRRCNSLLLRPYTPLQKLRALRVSAVHIWFSLCALCLRGAYMVFSVFSVVNK